MRAVNMKSLVSLALAISPILASPLERPVLVARQDFGSCRNQSCEVALVSGSTGETVYPYTTYPIGDTQAGDCCIIRHFPAVKNQIYYFRPSLQAYCAANGGDAPVDSNPPGVTTVTVAATATAASKRQATSAVTCKPKINIFVKGTLEPGDLGVTIGPSIQSGLASASSDWETVGFSYDNSYDNDYCLGLPGAITARGVLHQYVTQCPNSLIVMSGYSQGALVIRNALARAPAADVARVKNVVTFGDPFIGAKIGQYNGPIHVFCMNGDGVCNGQLDIGLAHLSYFVDVSQGVQIINATQP